MKKSLLALTVLGACTGSVFAQSSVTIYGVVDMALQHENDGRQSKTTLDSGEYSGSRIGFKGTEDLGGGLHANFTLESGFAANNGAFASTTRFFDRASWVGLSGGFGSVRVGRMSSPIFIVADTLDPFDAGLTSGKAGQATSTSGMLGIFHTAFRTDNTLNYTTADLHGFSSSLSYTFGQTAGSTTDNRQIGWSGAYQSGPVYAGIALQNVNDALGNTSRQKLIGGSYDFSIAKAAVAYQKNSNDLKTVDNNNWMIGVTVPVGIAGNVLASFIHSIDNTVPTDNAGSQWALGYTYDLSKRTTLYTAYSRNINDAKSNIGGLAAANGLTDTLFNVGIRHKF